MIQDTQKGISPGGSDNGSKMRVLLVDDDKFLVGMYGMKFAASGYEVQTCVSAADALDILRGGFIADAVVFDLIMPEMDGFSFLSTLGDEKLASHAARVALTNQTNDDEKARVEKLGVDRYVVKASTIPSEVVTLVGEEIAKKKKG
jgi:CheY-like chemotaxis protein